MTNDPPINAIEQSSVVGEYRLLQPLGEGGMGSVWLAEHRVLHKRFAVKFLLREYVCDDAMRARFEQEARTIGALDHPNIVSASNFGFTLDGQPYLVMEALRGQSMRALLDEVMRETGDPLTTVRAVELIRQACAGIAHAHEFNIVHRDLKPENLFVVRAACGADQVKVLDFGIAKIRGESAIPGHKTQTGMVLGTPYYMSPEQARGESDIDFRTDIYSLAAILYELLSGNKPHTGAQYNALLAHIITCDAAPLDEHALSLPSGLCEVVLKGLCRDRQQRFQSAGEFEQALAEFGSWRSASAPPQDVQGKSRGGCVDTLVVESPIEAHSKGAFAPGNPAAQLDAGSLAPSTKDPVKRKALPALAIGLVFVGGGFLWMKLAMSPKPPASDIGDRFAPAGQVVSSVSTSTPQPSFQAPSDVRVAPVATVASQSSISGDSTQSATDHAGIGQRNRPTNPAPKSSSAVPIPPTPQSAASGTPVASPVAAASADTNTVVPSTPSPAPSGDGRPDVRIILPKSPYKAR